MKGTLKFFVRAVGTIAGLIGLHFLVIGALMLRESPDWPVILLGVVWFGLLGAYLLYVTYLVWRRFSPLAVQHVCFLLALLLFASLVRHLLPEPSPSPAIDFSLRHLALFAGCIIGAYVFYRACCFALERGLFSAEKGSAEPSTGANAG